MTHTLNFKKHVAGLLMLGLALLAGTHAGAQSLTVIPCGTDERAHAAESEEVARTREAMEASLQTGSNARGADDKVYTIPVVFHLVHNNGPERISLATMQAQIATLNDAYRARSKDSSIIRSMWRRMNTDAHIEFKLATQDPYGNCTPGFDLVASEQTLNAGDGVKSLSMWDPSRYLNIWVVRSINQGNIQGILAGYAQFPWIAKNQPWSDGIVVNYQFVGRNQKTLVHEIGHYLGLYHPFQDGCSDDQKLQGDRVEDTPPVAEASFNANATSNTCHTDKPDLPDMWENYMDYNNSKLLFTPQQVARMRGYLAGARSTLVSEQNLSVALEACATGIAPAPVKLEATVYPNPATSSLNLTIGDHTGILNLQVTDLAGKQLYQGPVPGLRAGMNQVSLSTESINMNMAGLYLLKLQGTGLAETVLKVAVQP